MAVLALGLFQYWLLFRLELFLDRKTDLRRRDCCTCYRAISYHPSFFSILLDLNEEVQSTSMAVHAQGQQQDWL